MSFNPGEQVGPYRIMEQLGQGGMATVYKAYHASLNRYVAIKVLHEAFLEEPNFQARFQREAQVVAQLEHPNIVPIHDYAEHEKRPYLVMKFIEGETLKARLQSGPLSSEEIERIVDAVGAGLQHAHKEGILHRDIKPSNVILSKDGRIYLADFGLARIAQSGESTLTSDMVLGTPQYISPEQAMAKKDLDEGTDIYSFRVMIYEMVVGRVPFSADTPFSVIHDHIYTPLPLPSSVNPMVSPEVERMLLKTLAKDRPDRYLDVASMVIAFKEAWKKQNELAVSASKPESVAAAIPAAPSAVDIAPAVSAPARKIQKPKRRSRWVWIAAGAITLICLFPVFVLLTGKENIPGILSTNTSPPPSINTQAVYNPLPTKTSAPVIPVSTPPPNEPVLQGSPANWVPQAKDIPNELTYNSSKTNSNEDVAKMYDNPTEVFRNLEEWGRVTGYSVIYRAKDFQNTCTSETGLTTIQIQTELYQSTSGAEKGFAFAESRDKTIPDVRQEDNNVVGDKAYANWFDASYECSAPGGKNSSWTLYQIVFRRYNVLGLVYVVGVKGVVSEGELGEVAIRLAKLIDLRLVAEAK